MVSLIKSGKCRSDVLDVTLPQAPKPEPEGVKVTVCPPSRVAGHKPIGGRVNLRAVTEAGKLANESAAAIIDDRSHSNEDTKLPPSHYADDLFMHW